MIKNLFICLILVTCLQCQQPCGSPLDSYAVVKFLNFENKKAFGDSIQLLNMYGVGSADLLYDTTKANFSFKIPLSPAKDEITYTFNYRKNNIDNIYSFTLSYTRTPEIRHPDCGFAIQYSNLGVSQHNFDSLAVGRTTIDEDYTNPHVILYFKP